MTSALVQPRIAQIAYVVDDLETAARRHAALFGSGPFLDFGEIAMQVERGGTPYDLRIGNAFGQWGDVQIELMKPIRDDGQVLGSTAPGGALTCHHVAVFSDEPEQLVTAFAAEGMPLEFTVAPPGTDIRAYFVDASRLLGHRVEIYAPSALVTGIYRMVRDASAAGGTSNVFRKAALPI